MIKNFLEKYQLSLSLEVIYWKFIFYLVNFYFLNFQNRKFRLQRKYINKWKKFINLKRKKIEIKEI
jgi:hypothetical protein